MSDTEKKKTKTIRYILLFTPCGLVFTALESLSAFEKRRANSESYEYFRVKATIPTKTYKNRTFFNVIISIAAFTFKIILQICPLRSYGSPLTREVVYSSFFFKYNLFDFGFLFKHNIQFRWFVNQFVIRNN